MLTTVNEYKIQDWRKQTSNLEIRIIPNSSFVADNGAGGVLLEAGAVYRKEPVTVASELIDGYTSPVLTIPEIVIYTTTDAIMNRLATYTAGIYDTRTGKLIHSLQDLANFRVPVKNPTTWTDIIWNNAALPNIARPNFDEELKQYIDYAFLNRISGGELLADVTSAIASSPPTNLSLVNKSYVLSVSPPNDVTKTVDPTSGDDFSQGWRGSSVWYNTTTGTLFMCVGDGLWYQF